jgi:serine/threonine-protein phosphatase 2A regulatory subunit B
MHVIFSWIDFMLNRTLFYLDIVDIKPPNKQDLIKLITDAEFYSRECNLFAHSSSRGIIRLCDMRQSALCDRHCKGKAKDLIYLFIYFLLI